MNFRPVCSTAAIPGLEYSHVWRIILFTSTHIQAEAFLKLNSFESTCWLQLTATYSVGVCCRLLKSVCVLRWTPSGRAPTVHLIKRSALERISLRQWVQDCLDFWLEKREDRKVIHSSSLNMKMTLLMTPVIASLWWKNMVLKIACKKRAQFPFCLQWNDHEGWMAR